MRFLSHQQRWGRGERDRLIVSSCLSMPPRGIRPQTRVLEPRRDEMRRYETVRKDDKPVSHGSSIARRANPTMIAPSPSSSDDGRAAARVGREPGQVRKEAALSGTGLVPSVSRSHPAAGFFDRPLWKARPGTGRQAPDPPISRATASPSSLLSLRPVQVVGRGPPRASWNGSVRLCRSPPSWCRGSGHRVATWWLPCAPVTGAVVPAW